MTEAADPGSLRASDVIARAAAAYQTLAGLAETVEGEWQYVNDLAEAYLPGLQALAGEDPGSLLPVEAAAAIDEALAEIGLIADPNRAIDWLSTFPHVVALALGGDVDQAVETATEGPDEPPARTPAEPPDEDSPFRILLRDDR